VRLPFSISLVRHGRVHNPLGIFYGRLPRFGLGELGREDARAAARRLSDTRLDAVFSSPLLRAIQTAREVLQPRPHLKLQISRLLTEVANPYQEQPTDVVDALQGDIYTGAGPDFEQPADVLKRMLRFVRRVRRLHPGSHVAAATHGDPIAFLVLWAAGRPAIPQNKATLAPHGITGGYPATGSVTTLTFRTDDPEERPEVSYWRPRD
jgi:broad specificity phosphatase PhoE